MANGWLLDQEIDLAQPVSRQYTSPYGIAMSGDDRAQRLRYTVYDGQDAADISGTVKVYYRRPDDSLIESTSGGDYVTVEDNTITAELPPEAYEQKGTVECLVKLYASDGKIVTLARCDIEVLRGVENDETIIPAGEASRASLEDRVAALEVATGVVPIDQLPTLPHNPQSGDYLEVEDGNGPYKIDYEALADAIISRAAANNLTTTVEGKLLDARQGKSLNDTKLNKANVYNGLDKTVAGYALDARQGKALKDTTNAIAASVSDVYDSTATYAVGDYCIHDDSLYVCSTAIPTAEAWNATHWTAVTVTDAIAQSTANMYPIYNVTFTKTTSSSGYCSITNDEIAGRYIPIAIFVVGTSDVCVEISASGGTSTAQGSTTWWCACRKVDTWNAVANTSLTFAVYYIRT